jgi:drug/metabolite transporter (DMT)-like permease
VSAAGLAGGIVLGAGAACCFDGAVALQALEARAVERQAVGARMLARLMRRRRWLAATALGIAGWPLQVAALSLAPLTVVQPSLAVGLVLLLALGVRLLGEPARPRDLAAVGAIAAGLALLSWAAPEHEHVHAAPLTLTAALGSLGALALLPWLARGRVPGPALVIAAGCGYAGSGITTKLLADALAADAAAKAVGWAALTILLAGLALADEMAALQRVGAARVAAGAFALQTAVPVVLAPVLTNEVWTRPLPIVAGLLLVLAASLRLGVAAPVSRLIDGSAAR